MTDTGEVLLMAAQHLRQYNWQGNDGFGNRERGMCLHGGIYSALIELNGLSYSVCQSDNFDVYDVIWCQDAIPTDEFEAQSVDAVDALAALIPDTCSCLDSGERSGDTQNVRVYHYNDFHCTGGEDAALLLEQAAEKWRANHA